MSLISDTLGRVVHGMEILANVAILTNPQT